jgi:hypothetical protein
MQSTFEQKKRNIPDRMPLTINALQIKAKEIQAPAGLPTDRRRTDAKPATDLFACSQPLQGIECSQRIELDHQNILRPDNPMALG